MTSQSTAKSTIEQIRERFDNDVERFSRLEEGNTAQVDSRYSLDLIAEAAAAANPQAASALDVGCGAGNYTLKLLERLPNLNITLLDLSRPMLDRAKERVSKVTSGTVNTVQGDIRELDLGRDQFDIIIGAAVFHHLRKESEWELVFGKLYAALKPGGTVWIYDLVQPTIPALNDPTWKRYSDYLVAIKGEAWRDQVFGWIEQEDTPRPLMFQLDILRQVGFSAVEVLHKHLCFAAFGGQK
jgi:tRNA (cmo5U34)-methyltransferase